MRRFFRRTLPFLAILVVVGCTSKWTECNEDVGPDGVEEECTDGGVEELADSDGDGQTSVGWGGTDCDDADPDVYDGAELDCKHEATDADCSGVQDIDECDLDGDGQTVAKKDCDDEDAAVYLGNEEDCDDAAGKDNDCDGFSDDIDGDCDGDDTGGDADSGSSDTGG